ncbi:phosphate/phosphite/phosphonate ABC transporter substrate-binding protein [Nodosilinea sp. FACHB-131]|nr:phosphate/phosphite/phosphonate ABC transporter substrate-binding protein [Nodosilinea sp. FACHB-131]
MCMNRFRLKGWLSAWLVGLLALVVVVACAPQSGNQTADSASAPEATLTELKFGVGPYFPTPNENRKQFEPLFQEVAKQLDLPADVTVADDWIGISEALRSGTLDVAWLGPWGYVLAHHNEPALEAIATVKYKDKPTYYSVLMAKADAPFDTLDEAIALSQQGQKLKLSLADVGSTSGWLIPQAEFKRRGLDPEAVFDYNEGASHAAQAISVLSDQTDIASDYDRNLDVLTEQGKIDKSQLKIIWQSEPLPNDPIVVRGDFPTELKTRLQDALVNLTPEQTQALLPKNYTGFDVSDGSNYSPIEAAGKSVGKLE